MSKKMIWLNIDKQEKRRLQLSKRPKEGEVKSKAVDLHKRATAFFIALVMVLSILPMGVFLHVRAEGELLDPVEMQVRVNGVDNYAKVNIESGKIEDNIGAVEIPGLPEGCEYIKALAVNVDDKTETEIKSVGRIGNKYYYSLDENDNAGTEFDKSKEDLVLVFSNKYRININATENGGTFTPSGHKQMNGDTVEYRYLYAGEDLTIKEIEPALDYHINTISYVSGSSKGTVDITDGTATIPFTKIKGDITVNLDFQHSDSYTVTQGTIAQGDLCNDQGQQIASQTFKTEQPVNPVNAGNDVTFLVYSQSWTGGDKWVLNQLSINGKDLVLPTSYEVDGSVATTTLKTAEKNGGEASIATVSLKYVAQGLYWKTTNGKTDYNYSQNTWTKQRCIYEVTVTNVHEDLIVDGNFKDSTSRELIVKDLTGINKTAAAEQDNILGSRYYVLNEQSNNIYKAYYTAPAFGVLNVYPSCNLILYEVKPGYNPYTIDVSMSYDLGKTKTTDKIRDSEKAGKPVTVLVKASSADWDTESTGRYDTFLRYWGKNNGRDKGELYNTDATYGFRNKDLLLTTVEKDAANGTIWYAIAIAQNEAMDQQLYLKASPYEYQLDIDVAGDIVEKGGTSDGIAFTNSKDRFVAAETENHYVEKESERHSIESPEPYTYVPEDPTKSEYIFEYWVLVDENGNAIKKDGKSITFESGDRINIGSDFLDLLTGDNEALKEKDLQTIHLKAIWNKYNEAEKTKISVSAWRQVSDSYVLGEGEIVETKDGKNYLRYYSQEETKVVGDVALLNLRQPTNADYYVLNESASNVKGKAEQLNTDGTIPDSDSNKLAVYYDYKTVTVGVEKVVKGKTKANDFEITLTLKKVANSPVTVEEAIAMISASDHGQFVIDGTSSDTIKYTTSYKKGTKITFSNVPYGWEYAVHETDIAEPDYAASYQPSSTGNLDIDTELIVTNTADNPGIEVDKMLTLNSDTGKYDIDMFAYATGETYTEQLDSNVPLDIAIVLDQSGSMAYQDAGYSFVPYKEEGADAAKTEWTVNEAVGHYYLDGASGNNDNYHELKAKNDYFYSESSNKQFNNDFILSTGWHTNYWYHATKYFVKTEDGSYHRLFARSYGIPFHFSADVWYYTDDSFEYTSNGSHISPGTISKDGATPGLGAVGNYPNTIDKKYYEEASSRVNILNGYTYYALDGAGTGEMNSSSFKDLGVTLYEATSGNTDLYYESSTGKQFVGNHVNSNSEKAFSAENHNARVLFDKEYVTRLTAMKNAVNAFVSTIAQQAKANNVDHRISIIGFANNELPSGSSLSSSQPLPTTNIIGKSKYITTNTGLFVNGEFENYMTPNIPSGVGPAIKTNESVYNNITYFRKIGDDYSPINYDPERNNGTWYRTYETGNEIKGVYNDNIGLTYNSNNGLYYPTNSNTIYYPSVTTLNEQQYQQSLVKVYSNDDNSNSYSGNDVNDYIDSAIEQVNAYGGTHISYGLAMANNVFKYKNNESVDTTNGRKNVVVVFTDGMPGGGATFDDAAANEAKAAANIAKDEYSASVYTIGLYPEDASADSSLSSANKEKAIRFLHELSSEYFSDISNVYEQDLRTNQTYYYDDEDGRTHAVSFMTDSQIDWEHLTRKQNTTSDYDNRLSGYTYVDEGTGTFEEDGTAFTYGTCTNGTNSYYYRRYSKTTGALFWETTTYYHDLYPLYKTSPYWTPVEVGARTIPSTNYIGGAHEQSIWKDSEGWLRGAKWDADDTRDNFWQFFEIGEAQALDEGTFSYSAANAANLAGFFQQIAEELQYPTTTVKLDSYNSALIDGIVTENFDMPADKDASVSFETLEASHLDLKDIQAPADYLGLDVTEPAIEGIHASWDESNYLTVDGYDYSSNFISETKAGKVLHVRISGLTPKEGRIKNLESNTSDSGIYKDENLVVPLPRPSINIDTYTAKVTLKDVSENPNRIPNQKFTVTFKLTMSDGVTPYSGKYGAYTFDSNGVFKTTMNAKTEDFEFKEFDGLPPKSILTVSIADPDGTETYYSYIITDHETEGSDADASNFVVVDGKSAKVDQFGENHNNIVISVADKRRVLSVTNVTRGQPNEVDFSDKTKEFPIELLLYKPGDNNALIPVTGDVSFIDENGEEIQFKSKEDGTAVFETKLADGESVNLFIPDGYIVIARDKNNEEQDGYTTNYQLDNYGEVEEPVNAIYDNGPDRHDITIYHTANEVVISGVLDTLKKMNPFFYGAIAVALGGAIWLAIVGNRRRRERDE